MKSDMHRVIAIDGPAGAGKSTIARLLARRLGYFHIDSGSLYRATTWLLKQRGVEKPDDLTGELEEQILAIMLNSDHFCLKSDPEGTTRVYFDQQDITPHLRSQDVEGLVPFVAQRSKIRERMTRLQRQLANGHNVVVEGRDAGTVVFKNADLKFFLTANAKARAQRRFLELRRSNATKPLSQCIEEIEARDALDRTRNLSPLLPASDAIELDTSGYTVAESLETVYSHVARRFVLPSHPRLPHRGDSTELIAVSGLIGVGKSTLCKWLSNELSIPVFAENPGENPYIRSYYNDPERWALHSQMWFLYRKYELLSAIGDQKTPAIIDRTLHEDYMFAKVLLGPRELSLYEHWYRLVFSFSPEPSVVISLEASIPELLKRIARRGREYEQKVSSPLLETLSAEYLQWISEYSEVPVIRINTEKESVEDNGAVPGLVEKIRAAMKGEEVAG